ncbi:MAG: FAD:protein FMN transferase [Alphaproteobacteria bacterium]|nr:FAD:protein FMN transferase [Alphaproteobacteria bacterium]HPF47907.1 FAD:protein FMN transferase [Emcibacteraceae bacterium]
MNNRRRMLRIMALGTGVLVTPSGLIAKETPKQFYEWQGRAMGAETSLQLYSDNEKKAEEVIDGARSVIRKYEKLFSLYDPQSQISQLNQTGKLNNPDGEFMDLLKQSVQFYKTTQGAFDITIQPLWTLYKHHFGKPDAGNLDNEIRATLAKIGTDKITLQNNVVAFTEQGMGISFNGIAQGYITDKVTDYLKVNGFDNILVDIGEYRAGGPQNDGSPWRIGLLDPFDAVSITDVIEIKSGAVATSGGYGDQFDPSGNYHHLFDPRTGKSSQLYASVTVTSLDATTADALSTAFSNTSLPEIKEVLKHFKGCSARLTHQDGTVTVI